MSAIRAVRWCCLSQWLTDTRLYRKVSEALLRAQARRRLARIDAAPVNRCQVVALLGMLKQARGTRFGHEHDFRRISSVADYQRLVPLSTPQSLWETYWQPALPEPALATWPEAATQLARVQDADDPMHVPVSPSLGRAHWKALRTALALVSSQSPRHLAGDILFLGPAGSRVDAMLASGAAPLLSSRIRLGREGRAREVGPIPDEIDPVQAVLRSTPTPDVSCILADRERFGRMLYSLRWQTGTRHVREVWPQLSAVVLTDRCPPEGKTVGFALDVDGVEVRQACAPLEGPLALEDRRHDGLRMLGDLDTFYEFIPREELEKTSPARHTLADVEPGQDYAVAFTSPAGLWSCVTGVQVTFEKREPWMLRQIRQETVALRRPSRQQVESEPIPQLDSRPRRVDTPARRPGTIFRNAWSKLVDRG